VNIDDANTEPFYRFHRFNEEFNRNVRLTVGALGVVSEMGINNAAALKLLELPTDGEPWGDLTKWKSVTNAVPAAKRFISQIGTVRVISAFEDLLTSSKAEYDRRSESNDGQKAKAAGDEESRNVSLSALYHQLGWDKRGIEPLMPLFDYFVLVRNSIVHRSGRASAALSVAAQKTELATCTKRWHRSTGKRLPSLPTINTGKDVALLPRHAVLASEVCYRIALDVNVRLRAFLAEEGLVYMAAYHCLLSKDPIATNARSSAEAVINVALTGRYRVRLEDRHEAVTFLKSMGEWKACLEAFQQLNSHS
jgi:hypothetical protein